MSSAATIYVPQEITVPNWDFEQATTVPPPGWQLGGAANLNTSATLSYDTTTPYEGTQSLVVTATARNAGVTSTKSYPVQFGQIYELSIALKSLFDQFVLAQLIFYDVNGNQVAGISGTPSGNPIQVFTASGLWTVYTSTGTVPYGAVSAQIQVYNDASGSNTFEIDSVQLTLVSTAISYYLSLVPSQFQRAADFMNFLAALLQPLVDVGVCACSLNQAFDVNTAIGAQLNVLGVILGASRVLPFQPSGVSALTTETITSGVGVAVTTNNTTYMDTLTPLTVDTGGSSEIVTPTLVTPGVGFTATFSKNHSSGVSVNSVPPSQTMDDVHYRTLLQAQILKNQWNGQADSLWFPWQQLFPGGAIYITDNQNMTADVFLVGQFDGLYLQMIENGLIVPRPAGVQYIYEFATLPIFGFGNLNPTFVAGFGIGNWA